MSNNKKWKNKKINIKNYQVVDQKPKKQLSNSWKIALTGLLLIAIPSFLLFIFVGKDGWIFSQTKSIDRWSGELLIALGMSAIQITIVCLLVWKFKFLRPESLHFLIPITFAMNSFLVSSGVDTWYVRVIPAVGLAFLAIPILLLTKRILKIKSQKQYAMMQEEELKNKSLLD
ncbi:hypothetical protein [Mycoplasma phocoeninasale]|uniref:Uncharacterized protein n=1 Tax=Mycoplasma phocoeninasale TaxID=2726117 RepID=A0A858U2U9_9MOLU|nr:hypothetical protein [Mycoplasma phocoeninasale]MBN0970508.1 hypothetical protein [Mycoplasma phocoeninasale]QJG66369.1 hypothetical protein HGG64_01430 [Mycoplasma phocoeninasale]